MLHLIFSNLTLLCLLLFNTSHGMNHYWKAQLDLLKSQHDIIQQKLAMLGSSIDELNKNKVRLFLEDCRSLQRSAEAVKKNDTAQKAKACQQGVWRTIKELRIKLYR